MSDRLPRTAIVSPLPPAPTGIAEYSDRIGAELAKRAPVELLAPDEATKASEFDRVIYQIGNNGLHELIYRAALQHPGIAEIHDAVLHHLLLGMLDEDEYVAEYLHSAGKDDDWTRSLAEESWRRRAMSGTDERYFSMPMLRRLVESANGVIVHNPAARRNVEAIPNHPPIWEIPHYVDAPSRDGFEPDAELRGRWSIPDSAFVVTCFGYQRPTKRLGSVLEACRTLSHDYRLLVVGDFVDKDYESALAARLSEPDVIRVPFVDDADFWRIACLTDVCVNLRYPSAGETSGIAVKLMAAGKPVIVTAGEEYSAFPPGTLIRVDPGEAETIMLSEYLDWLQREPEAREAIGRAAAEHMKRDHSIARVIDKYVAVLTADDR